MLRVPERPAAVSWAEREDGEGGCRGACWGGLLRRRWLKFGAAARPGGDRGGCFSLGSRDHPGGQKVAHNGDGVGNVAVAVLPAPDVPRTDVEQPRDATLLEAECGERREFDCGQVACLSVKDPTRCPPARVRRARELTTSTGCSPMNEAAANISWLPFDPRDWEQLTPAFGRYRSLVDEPNNFVANNLAARCFDRNVHNGLLELALVRADGMYRLFDAAERQKLNIRVPLNYREGCGIEPFYAGRWYARRSDLDKLTTIPSPAARVEAELAPTRTSPTKLPQAEQQPQQPPPATQPDEPAGAIETADVGDLTGVVTAAVEPAAAPHPGGRPPVVNWEMVGEEVVRLMNDNGEFSVDDPEWNAQARLESAIADFCETKFGTRPGETTIRDHIREPLERWRQSRTET